MSSEILSSSSMRTLTEAEHTEVDAFIGKFKIYFAEA